MSDFLQGLQNVDLSQAQGNSSDGTVDIAAELGLDKLRQSVIGNLGLFGDSLPNIEYLTYAEERAKDQTEAKSKASQYVRSLLDGSLAKQAQQKVDDLEKQMLDAIDELSKPMPNPTADALNADFELTIKRMSSMSPAEVASMTNPRTQKPYTPDEWKQEIERTKQKVYSSGAKTDPYDVYGSLILMALDPGNADQSWNAAEQLRQKRYEVYRNAQVQEWDASQKAKAAKLELLGNRYKLNMDYLGDVKANSDKAAFAIYEHDLEMQKWEAQVKSQDWRSAVDGANEILAGIGKLPPEMIKGALDRYNAMARYANRVVGNTDILREFRPEDVNNIYREARRRQREGILFDAVYKQFWSLKQKWETFGASAQEKKAIDEWLATFGPQFDPANPEKERLLNHKDLGIYIATEGESTRTDVTRENNQARNTQANNRLTETVRHNKATEANASSRASETARHNQASEAIQQSKASSAAPKGVEKLKVDLDVAEKALKRLENQMMEQLPAINLQNPIWPNDYNYSPKAKAKKPVYAEYKKQLELVAKLRDRVAAIGVKPSTSKTSSDGRFKIVP